MARSQPLPAQGQYSARAISGRCAPSATRYSPLIPSVLMTSAASNPDPAHVSTSHIERANLTMRMANRRFTRITNAFSKKFDNHVHMVAIYTVWYNFLKMHKTLKMTPAMAAGVSKTLWSMEDLCEKMDAVAPKPGKRGPYKKRVTENVD